MPPKRKTDAAAPRRPAPSSSHHIPATPYAPGETVIVKSSNRRISFFVARIERIEVSGSKPSLYVRWYYRPEESIGGRKKFHGSKELFLSDHYDYCSTESVESTCIVHNFRDYTRLEKVGEEDFYCRFEYKASTGTFVPDSVFVYCLCEMPYNPDELMIQCEECKDWFHPECIKKSLKEVSQLRHFVCSNCCSV